MLVSVCIPAHNEAAALPALLASLHAALAVPYWPADWRSEVLLGANACNDGTETVFAERTRAAGRTLAADADRIISVPAAGKARAWNALTAAARGGVLVYCDADIRLEPVAVTALVTALQDTPAAQAAAGVLLAPARAQATALYRRLAVKMAEFAAKPAAFLNGPVYALRRGAVAELPVDVINDDLWLGICIGAGRIVRVPGAVGWQAPPAHWGEYYRREVRMRTGDLQARAHFGARYDAYRRATADVRSRAERQAALTAAERAAKRATGWVAWLQHAVDRCADRAARRCAARAAWSDCAWSTAASSKNLAENRA